MKEIDRFMFFSVGKREGIEFWTVEKSEVAQRHISDDTLFESDVTLVLQTRSHFYNKFTHNLHIWVGKDSAPEDVATAARYAALLDLVLRRRTTLHWERQWQECDLFMTYFRPALHYLPGKYTDYYHKEKEDTRKMQMFTVHASGKFLRTKQVECSISSLNKQDPIILMTEKDIYVLARRNWNIYRMERVADAIRYREGRYGDDPVALDNGALIEQWDEFYKLLGHADLNTAPNIPDAPPVEEPDNQPYKLYEILRNHKGDVYYKNIGFPQEKSVLDSRSLYIVSNGLKDINLWIGEKNQDRNKAKLYAMAKLQEFMTHSKWPHSQWTHLAIIPEGLESLTFRDHFKGWNIY